MQPLHGHKVLLGISGGIASYKSATLARRLIDVGAEVRVVMTAGAQAFIRPLTLQALTGEPVHTDLLDPAAEAAMGHIELARWADSLLIAPASANTLARLANGFADDLLSTLCLASEAPLYVAPAMNRLMWAHAATRDNVARLVARGVTVLGPAEGVQACGESGAGRMLEPETLRDELLARVGARRAAGVRASGTLSAASPGAAADVPSLAGLSIVLSAGPTREALDPVRYLSNRSSGRMGYALAGAAAARGARVTLVSGPVSLDTPPGVTRVDVVSALEMRAAVLGALTGRDTDERAVSDGSDGPGGGDGGSGGADVFIGVAAVADYRAADLAVQKIKKGEGGMTLELVKNPDILAEVAALPERPFCVGFAAETERVETHARAKLERKRLDLIAANHVARPGQPVFGSESNALDVYWLPDGHARIDTASKARVAERLLDLVAERLAATRDAAADGAADGAAAATDAARSGSSR